MSPVDAPPSKSGFLTSVQKVGAFLAGMVMPNIAAFLAFGIVTALFIPPGWTPNEKYVLLVDPMIRLLLPLLIGYTGGRIVHGQRGSVVGAIATMGIVVGAGVNDVIAPAFDSATGEALANAGEVTGLAYTVTGAPQFLGAMLIGPFAAWILKYVDHFTEERTKPGFEMLIENFTAAIVGTGVAILGLEVIGPVIRSGTDAVNSGVETLVNNNLLPLAHLIIEPAKVLFLNNALNHGIFSPLGLAEAAEEGKSILFLLEPNPGVGLGILTAYLMFGPRALRPSVPGAIIIHFFGGIHEIYFPYILMKPVLIGAAIVGGASGTLTFLITGAGLLSPPAPGSIFAILGLTPRGEWFGVLLGVLVAAGVTWILSAILMGFGRGEKEINADEAAMMYDSDEVEKLEAAKAASASQKMKKAE